MSERTGYTEKCLLLCLLLNKESDHEAAGLGLSTLAQQHSDWSGE